MPGYGLRAALLVVVTLLPAAAAFAQNNQTIEFSSAVPATIRQTSGVVARGSLVKITPTQVVIRNAKGKVIELAMTTVRTLRTLDGELQYIPSQDSYEDLLKRASRVEYATLGSATSSTTEGGATISGPRPNRPPAFALRGSLPPRPAGDDDADDAGGFANPGGFDGIDTAGFGPPRNLQPMPGRAEPRTPVAGTSEPAPAGEEGEPALQPRQTGFEPVMQPPARDASSTAPAQPPGPAQPPPAGPAPAGGAAPQEFSFSALPMWAKVGFFGAMVGVFYMIVLRKW